MNYLKIRVAQGYNDKVPSYESKLVTKRWSLRNQPTIYFSIKKEISRNFPYGRSWEMKKMTTTIYLAGRVNSLRVKINLKN